MQPGIIAGRLLAVSLLAGLALADPAHSQNFPAKPVRLIVPFPAGGPADVMGRIYADKLGARWGQPVVIDNRGGAAGNIGAEMAAKSAPDGYTLLLVANSHVINASLYGKLPYDPVKDFTPLSEVTYYALVLVAHPGRYRPPRSGSWSPWPRRSRASSPWFRPATAPAPIWRWNCFAAWRESISCMFPTRARRPPPTTCWPGRGS